MLQISPLLEVVPMSCLRRIASNTPIIITGALPGQEEDNPAFAEKSNLGVICKEYKRD